MSSHVNYYNYVHVKHLKKNCIDIYIAINKIELNYSAVVNSCFFCNLLSYADLDSSVDNRHKMADLSDYSNEPEVTVLRRGEGTPISNRTVIRHYFIVTSHIRSTYMLYVHRAKQQHACYR